MKKGFTLIELSIVLVIVGLIIGGVLVGKDLIRSSATRATITQIEKLNAAVNTFRNKYGYLPGDIKDPYATQFGLTPRGAYDGEGDGNDVVAGTFSDAAGWAAGNAAGSGEAGLFWRDLSTVNLIEGAFTAATYATPASPVSLTSSPNIAAYFPEAKLGKGNYVYVWSGATHPNSGGYPTTGITYFGISAVTAISAGFYGGKLTSSPNITVAEAYAIDKKMDDGLPTSGSVTAQYVSNDPIWADGQNMYYIPNLTLAEGASATSCFDNGNVGGVQQHYSLSQNNGAGLNCGLSLEFQ